MLIFVIGVGLCVLQPGDSGCCESDIGSTVFWTQYVVTVVDAVVQIIFMTSLLRQERYEREFYADLVTGNCRSTAIQNFSEGWQGLNYLEEVGELSSDTLSQDAVSEVTPQHLILETILHEIAGHLPGSRAGKSVAAFEVFALHAIGELVYQLRPEPQECCNHWMPALFSGVLT